MHQSLYGGPQIEPLNQVTQFLIGERPGTTGSGKPASEKERGRTEKSIGGLIGGVVGCEQESVGLQKIVPQFS